jgi:Ca-activated chloride channel family protein
MMRILFSMMLLAIMVPAHAGEFWSGLWRNADQQGEALLQRGDASNAAKVYADPRRKAYAKLQAGDYQGAAKDLGELHDSDADYNRGNALAHAGDLQGALDAYDAALKSDPNNQDAKHNRELVANALKQQPPQQQKSGDKKSQDEKRDGQQGKDSPEQNKQDGSSKQNDPSKQDEKGKQGEQSGKDNQTGKGQDSNGKNKQDHSNKQDQKSQDGKSGENKSGSGKQTGQDKNGQQANTGQADNKEANNKAGQSQQGAAKNEAEQARRDAEASLGKPAADGKQGAGDEANASAALPGTPPKTEKQIAQEQWLRSIPEEPGGLLRRKFMIEHMIRQ